MTELSACAQMVRRHDRDRFLCALFAPADRREDLLALYAFNLEIAKTREVAREPMLGQIRLQWWRDTVAGIYAGQPRRHEVVQPLAAAIARHGLARGGFEELIDARETDLEDEPPATLGALEAYAAATGAGLNALALGILGAAGAASAGAGRHVGTAWALTGLIRALPFHARQKRLFIPKQICEQNNLNIGLIMEMKFTDRLDQALGMIADLARGHLRAARGLRAEAEPSARPILLAATLADHYLDRLARAGYDVFRPDVVAPARLAGWRLAWRWLVGGY
jgi:phytoene synthase